MKANAAARNDIAGAETVGALILFGIFVGTIAFLNVTAVPQAGLLAEEEHFLGTLSALNGLQASAEAASLPGGAGTTVSQAVLLGPAQTAGSDFFSYFVATPAQASGELIHNSSYGNITISHVEDDVGLIYDVGSATTAFPIGQVAFDPHPVFRNEGVVSLENGALLTADGTTEALRYAPPVTVSEAGGVTYVSIKARILNGTSASIGGGGPARITLATEATTLTSPQAANAERATLRLETAYGSAWGSYLNTSSQSAGLTSGSGYTTTVQSGSGANGLDIVTWIVEGTGSGNDVRLTTGLSLLKVTLS